MAPIIKLTRKTKPFLWTIKHKKLGSDQVEVHGSIDFNTSKLVVGFHVPIDASMLVVGAMLAQNPIGKYD
jgi:hypothetical protein